MIMRDETYSARKSLFHLKGTVSRAAGQSWQLVRTFLPKWIWRGAEARRGWFHAPGRIPWQSGASLSSNPDKPNPINGEIMTKHLLNRLPSVLCGLALLLGLAPAAYGGVPSMNVTVFDANGKVAFKGPMSANATFTTRDLRPGNYVVQFNAKSAAVKGQQYLLVVSAGKTKVIAADVPGEKFMAGGVAMKVDVGPGLNIKGQVAVEQAVAQGGSKYRVIDGKRYFWVSSELGSNRGGRWVDESLPTTGNVIGLNSEAIRKIQDRGGEGSMLNGYGYHHEAPTGY